MSRKSGFPESLFDYCSIEECKRLGTNYIAIMIDDLFDSHYLQLVCDEHYNELMSRYYENTKKKMPATECR